MASEKIEDPSIYAGPPTKIITVGSVVHSYWEYDYDVAGNRIKGTNRQINLFGSEVRLYTTRFRQRDGSMILTKLGTIETYVYKYDPAEKPKTKRVKSKDVTSKKHAVHLAKGLAKQYDWFYLKKAGHNDRVSEELQAYLELEALENR